MNIGDTVKVVKDLVYQAFPNEEFNLFGYEGTIVSIFEVCEVDLTLLTETGPNSKLCNVDFNGRRIIVDSINLEVVSTEKIYPKIADRFFNQEYETIEGDVVLKDANPGVNMILELNKAK